MSINCLKSRNPKYTHHTLTKMKLPMTHDEFMIVKDVYSGMKFLKLDTSEIEKLCRKIYGKGTERVLLSWMR